MIKGLMQEEDIRQSVQYSCSVMFDSATLWTEACQASLSITNSRSLLKLTSFTIDGFDLLAVQGTLKSLLQHQSSKASVFGTQLF